MCVGLGVCYVLLQIPKGTGDYERTLRKVVLVLSLMNLSQPERVNFCGFNSQK